PMDGLSMRIGQPGIDSNFAHRRVEVTYGVTAQANNARETRRQPAVLAMTRSGDRATLPVLYSRKVFVHFARRPGCIASSILNGSPVAIVRTDYDHRVMCRTAA